MWSRSKTTHTLVRSGYRGFERTCLLLLCFVSFGASVVVVLKSDSLYNRLRNVFLKWDGFIIHRRVDVHRKPLPLH